MGSWRDSAACRDKPSDWWMLEPLGESGDDVNREALRICLSCPVRQECWDDAVEHGDFGVIRGGGRLSRHAHGAMPRPRRCHYCSGEFLRLRVGEKYDSESCKNRTAYAKEKARGAA